MGNNSNTYQRNYSLIVLFIVLISFVMVAAMFFSYRSTARTVRNLFYVNKSDVQDSVAKSYYRLIKDSIPVLSYYKGFLDTNSFSPLAAGYIRSFPFIDGIVFYNLQIGNRPKSNGMRVQHLTFSLNDVTHYRREKPGLGKLLYDGMKDGSEPPYALQSKASEPIYNFISLVGRLDSGRLPKSKELSKYFLNVSDLKISYMNVPEREELKSIKNLLNRAQNQPEIEQDLVFFELNPAGLPVVNLHPRLYEKIIVRPLLFDSLESNKKMFTTAASLPKAFSDFKLYFISSSRHLNQEVLRQFMPNVLFLFLAYLLLLSIAFLIFRNLNINNRLYKLQYDFINNLTHEFKTPVSVIKIAGNNIRTSQLLGEEEQTRYGQILDEEADKLNELINRLLAFSQLENNTIKLKSVLINVDEFCEEIIEGFKIKFPDFDIRCRTNNVGTISADRVLLHTVFVNLADNAYKYSYPGNRHLLIHSEKFKNKLVIRFSDQGIGIPEKEIDNVFKKFYKVENEFNQQGSVGIGLAFCKEIISLMGGEMSVNSVVGKGTEFIVKLPMSN